jgi:hypothetical protein
MGRHSWRRLYSSLAGWHGQQRALHRGMAWRLGLPPTKFWKRRVTGAMQAVGPDFERSSDQRVLLGMLGAGSWGGQAGVGPLLAAACGLGQYHGGP